MNQGHPTSPILMLGKEFQSGVYVLRLQVHEPLAIGLGRFKKGKTITFLPGEYVYVGSALGATGSTSLARRLMRHASRSAPHPPHLIQPAMLDYFQLMGMGCTPLAKPKQLFWHIDYLLDQATVELRQIFALRTTRPLEATLAHFFEADPATFIVESGIGAQDHPGHTHLLGVQADAAWWAGLGKRLQQLLEDE